MRDVAARRAVGDGGKVLDDEDDDFVDIDAELASAVEAYERFYAEAVATPAPPPRPSLDERTTASSPPRPAAAPAGRRRLRRRRGVAVAW